MSLAERVLRISKNSFWARVNFSEISENSFKKCKMMRLPFGGDLGSSCLTSGSVEAGFGEGGSTMSIGSSE
jgi:hypothetical protein